MRGASIRWQLATGLSHEPTKRPFFNAPLGWLSSALCEGRTGRLGIPHETWRQEEERRAAQPDGEIANLNDSAQGQDHTPETNMSFFSSRYFITPQTLPVAEKPRAVKAEKRVKAAKKQKVKKQKRRRLPAPLRRKIRAEHRAAITLPTLKCLEAPCDE